MAYEDINKQAIQLSQSSQAQMQAQQGQGAYFDDGYDRYPIPNDPYAMRAAPQNPNAVMLNALLDTGLKDGQEFEEVNRMFVILNHAVKRIPNVEMVVVKSIQRKFKDISFMVDCQGQEQRALTKMKDLLFEINSLGAYGGAPLNGISTIGAMMTTVQKQEQKISYPQEPQKRQKIFGLV